MKRLAISLFVLLSLSAYADSDPANDEAIKRSNIKAAIERLYFVDVKMRFIQRIRIEAVLRACGLDQLAETIMVTDAEMMPILLDRFTSLKPEVQQLVCGEKVCAHDVYALLAYSPQPAWFVDDGPPSH